MALLPRALVTLAPLLALAACQGLPFVIPIGPPGSAPPAATPTPPVGACAAPAVVIPSPGEPYAVDAGFAAPGSGRCVPVSAFLTGRAEALSAGGGFRLSVELPAGAARVGGGPVALRIGLRYASGSQTAIPDADVRVKRQLIAPGGAVVEGPATSSAGTYRVDGVTWGAAGRWLVTIAFTAAGTPDAAYLALDVAP